MEKPNTYNAIYIQQNHRNSNDDDDDGDGTIRPLFFCPYFFFSTDYNFHFMIRILIRFSNHLDKNSYNRFLKGIFFVFKLF